MDPQRLCRIWDEHHARLLLIARSMGDPAAAEDAVQEAFIELARQAERPGDVVGWMVRVIRNRMLDWHRSGQRRRRREQEHARVRWFDDQAAEEGDADELQAALEALAPDARQIVVMHLWGEMTFQQIGDATGASSSAVHRHYHNAIAGLRSKLIQKTGIKS